MGENHPQYAGLLFNLGNLYYLMGCFEKAEPLMKQALEIASSVQDDSYRASALSALLFHFNPPLHIMSFS